MKPRRWVAVGLASVAIVATTGITSWNVHQPGAQPSGPTTEFVTYTVGAGGPDMHLIIHTCLNGEGPNHLCRAEPAPDRLTWTTKITVPTTWTVEVGVWSHDTKIPPQCWIGNIADQRPPFVEDRAPNPQWSDGRAMCTKEPT